MNATRMAETASLLSLFMVIQEFNQPYGGAKMLVFGLTALMLCCVFGAVNE